MKILCIDPVLERACVESITFPMSQDGLRSVLKRHHISDLSGMDEWLNIYRDGELVGGIRVNLESRGAWFRLGGGLATLAGCSAFRGGALLQATEIVEGKVVVDDANEVDFPIEFGILGDAEEPLGRDGPMEGNQRVNTFRELATWVDATKRTRR